MRFKAAQAGSRRGRVANADTRGRNFDLQRKSEPEHREENPATHDETLESVGCALERTRCARERTYESISLSLLSPGLHCTRHLERIVVNGSLRGNTVPDAANESIHDYSRLVNHLPVGIPPELNGLCQLAH